MHSHSEPEEPPKPSRLTLARMWLADHIMLRLAGLVGGKYWVDQEGEYEWD